MKKSNKSIKLALCALRLHIIDLFDQKQLMDLEKLRTELSAKEKSLRCNKCSGSLKTSSLGGSYNNLNKASMNGLGSSSFIELREINIDCTNLF